MPSKLHFVLRPSLIKIWIRLGLCLILGYLLLQTIPSIFVVIILLLLITGDFFYLRRRAISEVVHLDDTYWTIKSDNKINTVTITNGFIWCGLAILIFLDEESERKRSVYIAKDQLKLNEWKILKKFIKLR